VQEVPAPPGVIAGADPPQEQTEHCSSYGRSPQPEPRLVNLSADIRAFLLRVSLIPDWASLELVRERLVHFGGAYARHSRG
jgi:hypothetical protein